MKAEVTKVFTRDRSTGRIHVRYRVADRLISDEADNLDDAGGFEEVDLETVEAASPEDRCERCFPTLHDPEPAA